MRNLFVFDFEDMEAVGGFDQAAHFARLQRKSHRVEFRHGLPVDQPPEFAARLGRAVLRVFLGEVAKVAAGANLVQHIGRGLLNGRHLRRGSCPSS